MNLTDKDQAIRKYLETLCEILISSIEAHGAYEEIMERLDTDRHKESFPPAYELWELSHTKIDKKSRFVDEWIKELREVKERLGPNLHKESFPLAKGIRKLIEVLEKLQPYIHEESSVAELVKSFIEKSKKLYQHICSDLYFHAERPKEIQEAMRNYEALPIDNEEPLK